MKQIIQKAIVKKGKKYLLLLRSPTAEDYPEYWDFPGGKLEEHENPLRGVEREVKEETGMIVKALKPAATYDEFEDDKQWHFIIYSSKIISGDVELSSEHTKFKWATKEEILTLKTQPFITAYFRQAKT